MIFLSTEKKSYIEMIKCYVEKFNLSIDIMRTHANIWTNKPKCIYRMLYVCGVMLFVFMCVCVCVWYGFSGHWNIESFCVRFFFRKLFNNRTERGHPSVFSIHDKFKSMKLTANNDEKYRNVDLANRAVNDSP